MDQITTAFTGLPGWVQIALAVALIIFGFAWAFNFLRVLIGGEGLERRVAGLRGNFFATYREGLARGLDGLASWIGDKHPQGPMPFSGGAYLTCLGLATVYPLFFITVSWAVLGGAATFAGMEVFPANATTAQRWLVVAAMVGPGAVAGGLRFLKFSEFWAFAGAVAFAFAGAVAFPGAVAVAFDSVGAVAFAGAVAVAFAGVGAVAFAFAFAGAVAGAVAFAGAVAVAFAFAGAGAGVVAGAFAFAGAVAVAFSGAEAVADADRNRHGWALVVPIGLLLLLPALALALAGGEGWIIPLDQPHPLQPGQTRPPVVAAPIVLFLALLPVVNAPFDWASLGVTRGLLGFLARWGEDRINLLGVPVIGQTLEFVIILIDFLIALALAFLIVVATAAGTALFSQVHMWAGGAQLYDVARTINEVRADPWNQRWLWIYAMMFWTIVPTLVHFIAFSGAVFAATLQSIGGVRWLGDWAAAANESKNPVSALGVSLFLALLTLAPSFFALALLYEFLPQVLEFLSLDPATIGGWLADWSAYAAALIQGQ